jgi:ribonuclease HII
MKSLEDYKEYEFNKHKGYGTKKHIELIEKYGLSDIHRTSFKLKKNTKIVNNSLF